MDFENAVKPEIGEAESGSYFDNLDQLFLAQKSAFRSNSFANLDTRRDRLKCLLRLIDTNAEAFIQAIDEDFGGRSTHETRLTEIHIVRSAILQAQAKLQRWMSTKKIRTALAFLPGRNRLIRQPLGVVGIVAPWNYPLQLSLAPAVAALAAGNHVLIKPSELTPRFSELLMRLMKSEFDQKVLAVVTGGQDIGRAFSALPFDHLFFTGSTEVGRQVAIAAARNLTPVTLELGGKSPAILDRNFDAATAARRIAFGKFINAGQTCIAPDYLMVPRGQAHMVATQILKSVQKFWPSIEKNQNYTSIITTKHRARLEMLIAESESQGATILKAHASASGNKLSPTLVILPSPSSRLMQEEIFGPVLPIIEYDAVDDAINHVKTGQKPLALYWFGNDRTARDRLLHETISGGVCINDCLWHLAQENQPFGGVGPSGMGAYHGEWGFRTFSKEKPVFYQAKFNGTGLLAPPYGARFNVMMKLIRLIG